MLRVLRVRQFAIIQSLELELGPGLNIVTGETGAGKSVIVHALQLVLGARARAEVVRTGADRAVVEALFELPEGPLRARLAHTDLLDAEPEQLVIRRTVFANGRSQATVNGQLTTIAALRTLAEGLVDISSQHAHTALANPATHLQTLDAFAAHAGLLEATARAVGHAEAVRTELHALEQRLTQRSDREDLLRYQRDEIDRWDPQPDELDALEAEAERLRAAALLAEVTADVAHALQQREGPPHALCVELCRMEDDLGGAARHDARLTPVIAQLRSARLEIEDVADSLGRYQRGVVHDPARLAEIEERRDGLRRLARKYGGDLGAVLRHRQAAQQELDDVGHAEQILATREREFDLALACAGAAATELSAARRAAADALGVAITVELRSLGMGAAVVSVELAPLAQAEGALVFEGVRLGLRGMDRAELCIAPNPGEAPRPLRRIASGGELSRALLAIKRVLARLGSVELYVFDEVDSGVGGAVSETIGRKLAEVAAHHQVLCITHQPQIAAYAERHMVVSKQVIDTRTASSVRRLGAEEQVEELARMMGGIQISNSTREAARELLQVARSLRA